MLLEFQIPGTGDLTLQYRVGKTKHRIPGVGRVSRKQTQCEVKLNGDTLTTASVSRHGLDADNPVAALKAVTQKAIGTMPRSQRTIVWNKLIPVLNYHLV